IAANSPARVPDEAVIDAELTRALRPFGNRARDTMALRETRRGVMWDDLGVIRDRAGIDRALTALDQIEAELLATGLADDGRAFNLTWHDWLNLRSLVETSRVIALAALVRENSRGAHFREDFPGEGDLATSTFTVARQSDGKINVTYEPVRFTIVRPGETLMKDQAAAE